MKKHWVLVGILAGSLCASDALAQHQAPNQQPQHRRGARRRRRATWRSGRVHLPKAVTADGKPLPAGTYQVRLTAQEAKPDAVGASENARALGRVRAGRHASRAAKSSASSRRPRVKMVVKDAPPAAGALEGPGPARQRVRARVDQQGREPLPDSPAGERRDAWSIGGREALAQGRGLKTPPYTEQRPLRCHHVELLVMQVRVGLDA